MPAPKGNKYAVGNHNAGRPAKYDLDQESNDLLEWSKLDSSTCLHGFCDDKDYVPQQLTQFAKQSEVFSLSLKKAKSRIAKRREELCNEGLMNYGVWARSCTLYDKELYDHEDTMEQIKHKRALDKIDYEIKKKNEVQAVVSEEVSKQFDALMAQISAMQSNKS